MQEKENLKTTRHLAIDLRLMKESSQKCIKPLDF